MKKKQKSHLPLRLNLLFFVIFLLFSILILQLGVVQILYGEDAQQEIDRTEIVTSKTAAPRGKIYDRNGTLLVDNEPTFAITYTPKRNVQPHDNLELARKLVHYMDMNTSSVTFRDRQDYWIMIKGSEAYEMLLSEEERNELSNQEQYQLLISERITEEQLSEITKEELKIIAIKRELDQAYELTPHVIKRGEKDITQEEYAVISENLHELPGINVTVDWDREKLFAETFSSYIGGVTTARQGVPRDQLPYYLSRNYNRNDRVGTSGLEQQYELYLSGQKEQRRHVTNSSGEVISTEVISNGQRGKDLMLTIDIEMQQILDEIVREELENTIKGQPNVNQHMNEALAVMMNPQTGEIIAISGQYYDWDKDEFRDDSFRVIYDAHLPGSTIKGATILAGYDSGVISVGDRMFDRPIDLYGTETMSSVSNMGWVNDLDALRRSSNVYMFFIALRMGGEYNYYPNIRPTYNPQAFVEMQNYFKQFGLGVETGIDFPYEATGVRGDANFPGLLMHFSIGQYESYTTLQLAQYVSTIANGGYRMKPYLVKQIHEPMNSGDLGPIYQANEPTVLNRVDMDDHLVERVQEGFRQAFQEQGGTGYWTFHDAPYSPAGKTGTAQFNYWEDGVEINTQNLSLVGYAPHDNPEVAFAIMVPKTGINNNYRSNLTIGRRLLDEYFALQERRQGNNTAQIDEEEDLEENEEDENSEE